jgi:hypothetical protein
LVASDYTLTWNDFWEPFNEHRLVLPKLIWLALSRASGTTGIHLAMYLSVAFMSLATALLLTTARRLRGHASLADLIFPAMLLHWGQAENFIWGFQVQMTLPTLLAIFAFTRLVRFRERPRIASLAVAGACALLLPLNFASGVALMPFILVGIGMSLARLDTTARGGQRKAAWLLAVLLAVCMALMFLAAVPRPTAFPAPESLWQFVWGASRILAMAWGPAGESSPLVLPVLSVALVVGVSVWLAARVWNKPRVRLLPLNLLLFVLAFAALAAAISYGRIGCGMWAVLMDRYATLLAPCFCAAYLALSRARATAPRRVAAILAALALALSPSNYYYGYHFAADQHQKTTAFLEDMRQGMDVYWLSIKHQIPLHGDQDALESSMLLFQSHQLGEFRRLNIDVRERRYDQ